MVFCGLGFSPKMSSPYTSIHIYNHSMSCVQYALLKRYCTSLLKVKLTIQNGYFIYFISTCLVFSYKYLLTTLYTIDRKMKNIFCNTKHMVSGLVEYFYMWRRFNCDYNFDHKIDYICGLIYSNILKSDIKRFVLNMYTTQYNYI